MSDPRTPRIRHFFTVFTVVLALAVVCSTATPFVALAATSTADPAESPRIDGGAGEAFAAGGVDSTAPTVSTSDGTTHYATAGGPTVVDPEITITSESSLSGATVSIGSGFDPSEDSLDVTTEAGITKSYNANTGVLTLSGTATAAKYQQVLRTVTYDNSAEEPSAAEREITFATGNDSLYFDGTGHYYQFVPDPGVTWKNARGYASDRTHYGLRGYLATVTSDEEDEFITSKLNGKGWIGASDNETNGVWKWVTGPENGTIFYTDPDEGGSGTQTYSNWKSDEPNDRGYEDQNGGNENYGHSSGSGGWNDYPNNISKIDGYVIEYGGLSTDPDVELQDTKTVSVSNAPTASTTANRTTVPLDGSVALDASDSSDDNGITDYSWSVTGGSLSAETGETTTATFTEAGTQEVTLTVTDADGNTDTTTLSVTVDGTAPTADAGENRTVDLGDAATFDASGSTDDTDVVSYEWAFDDGTNATGVSPTHTFSSGGDHTATLTVTDTAGNTATDTTTVHVRSANVSVRIDSPDPTVTAGETLSVNATVTNDGDLRTTQSVTFRVGGSAVNTTDVTLDGESSETVEFTYRTTASDTPSLDVTVTTGDSTDTTTATVLTPGNFAVGNLSVDDPVTAGSDLTVTATVTNTGETAGTQDITTSVDGAVVGTQSVTLDAGESETVETVYTTSEDDVGDLDVTVASDDETANTTARVNTPASFGVSIDGTNGPVTAGEELTVEGTVTNDGGTTAIQRIPIAVDGSVVDTRTVSLDPGESTPISFTYTTTENDLPGIEVSFSSDDDSASTTVDVRTPTFFAVNDTTTNEPVTVGRDLVVDSTVTNTGETAGMQTVSVSVDDTVIDTQTVMLTPGESRTVETTYSTTEGDVGDRNVTVASDDDSETVTAEVLTSGALDVDIDGTNGPVTAGDDLIVTGTITNTGQTATTQSIPLSVNGTVVGTRSVTLGPGESTSVEFTYATTEDDVPHIEIGISSDDDRADATADVRRPGNFVVGIDGTNGPVTAGDDLVVTSTVTNTGDVAETQAVNATVDGAVVGTQNVTLDPGESTPVNVTYSTTGDDVPSVDVTVNTEDDSDDTTAAVNTPADFDVAITGTNGPVTVGEDLVVKGVVTNNGGTEATQDIPLTVGGRTVATESVTLASGESAAVSYTYPTIENDTPALDLRLDSDDDSDSLTVLLHTPAFFDVTNTTTNGPLTAGDDLVIGSTVTNTGETAATQPILVTVDGRIVGTPGIAPESENSTKVGVTAAQQGPGVTNGTVVEARSLTLAPGESRDIDVTYPTNASDTPALDVSVRSADDTDNATVEVLEPGALDVRIDGTSGPVTAGDDLIVNGIVTNTGGTTVTQAIQLTIDGNAVGTRTVTLGPGESMPVEYTYRTTTDTPNLSVSLSSNDSSATTSTAVLRPGVFDVSNTTVGGPVTAGENVRIDSTVTNTGETNGTQQVTITANGTVVGTRNVTLGPDESTPVNATYRTTESDVPSVEVTVESVDDSESATVNVTTPPNFSVTINGTNGPVTAGDDLVVDSVVTNDGGTADTQRIPITANGVVIETRTITLEPGESTPIHTVIPTTAGDAPALTVTVCSDDGSESATVTVDAPIPPAGTPTTTTQTATATPNQTTQTATVTPNQTTQTETATPNQTRQIETATTSTTGTPPTEPVSPAVPRTPGGVTRTPATGTTDVPAIETGPETATAATDAPTATGTTNGAPATQSTASTPATGASPTETATTVTETPVSVTGASGTPTATTETTASSTAATATDSPPATDATTRGGDEPSTGTRSVSTPAFVVDAGPEDIEASDSGTVRVAVTVVNTGETTDTQSVTVSAGGRVVATTSVELDPGGSRTVTLTTSLDVEGIDDDTTLSIYTPADRETFAFDDGARSDGTNDTTTTDAATVDSTTATATGTVAENGTVTENGTIAESGTTADTGATGTNDTTVESYEIVGSADPVTVTASDGAGSLSVTVPNANVAVNENGSVTATATLTDRTNATVTRPVTLTVDGEVVDTVSATVEPNETKSVTLSTPEDTVSGSETTEIRVQTPSGGVTKTVGISDDGETSVEAVGSNTSAGASAFYQVDLVAGQPIEDLGESGTYGSDDLIRFAHGDDDGLTRLSAGTFTTNERLNDRVTTDAIAVENGTATTTVTVSSGTVTLSLVSYEKVGPGWTRERESLQTVADADTRTLGPGTYTFSVELPGDDSHR